MPGCGQQSANGSRATSRWLILCNNAWKRWRRHTLQRQPCRHPARHLAVTGCLGAVRATDDGRLSTVRLLANRHRQRQGTKQLCLVLVRQFGGTTSAKNMLGMAALAAHMHRHVFDNTEHADADLAKHLDAL